MQKTVALLGASLALGLGVLGVAVGAWWWSLRSAAVGPLASEALVLPADAAFVGGVDVRRVVAGNTYRRFLKRSLADAAGLQEFQHKTGIDPERDVSQVYFAGRKADGQQTGVALFLGRFEPARIVQALQSDRSHKPTTRSAAGATIYVSDVGGPAFAVASDSLVLAGSPELVKATLERRAASERPLLSNEKLCATLRGLPPAPVLWLVAGADLIETLPRPTGLLGGMPLPSTIVFSAELDPNVLVALSGELADEAAARKLAETLTGLKAMAAMFAADKPELKDVASGLTVKAEARQVLLSLQLSPAALDRLEASVARARALPSAPEAARAP